MAFSDENMVMPVAPTGFGGGYGFGNDMWVIILFILLAGGGFGGWGGNNSALDQDVQRGFDNQNLQAQTRDILSAVTDGTAQTVSSTNQTFHDNLSVMQNLYNEVQRDIAALAVGQANAQANQDRCCCETKQLILQNNYDAAMRDAATNANFTAQIQGVKDMMAQNKIEALQAQVSRLELEAATSNVLRYPNAWTYPAAPPFLPPTVPTTTTTPSTGA